MISLLYATARPEVSLSVVNKWMSKANPNFATEIILVTDNYYPFENLPDNLYWFINNGSKNCVTAYNLAATKAFGDILFQISDDLYPKQINWNQFICETLNTREPQALAIGENFVNTDGYTVMRHAVINLPLYEKWNYLLYPEYESMFSDDDFSGMAHKYAAQVIDARDLIKFQHDHVGPHKDEVAAKHEALERYYKGRDLYYKRRAKGFPI